VKKPVLLSNGRAFATQGEARQFFSDMLKRYQPTYEGQRLRLSEEDHGDAIALIHRFDELIREEPSKIGAGVDHIFVQINASENWRSAGFWVQRVDGSATDFSYLRAVVGRGLTRFESAVVAAREVVFRDVQAAKIEYFAKHQDDQGRVKCELTGELITWKRANADHPWPTFAQLVQAFLAAHGWFPDIPADLVASGDGVICTEFTDPAVAASFREYHRRAATLRIIRGRSNSAMAAGQRRPKIKNPIVIDRPFSDQKGGIT
jgi:hypothetical protein